MAKYKFVVCLNYYFIVIPQSSFEAGITS